MKTNLRGTLVYGLLSLGTVQGDQYGWNSVTVRKDSELVASNFPDVQGVTLQSPAFSMPDSTPPGFENGTAGPTPDDEMDYYMRSLASGNDWMTYNNFDFKSEEGRSTPYIFLSTSSQSSVNTTEKLRVWLQGGVHGNEPAGDQSLLALLGKMDSNQTWAASLLEKMDILVYPRYNLDGVAYFQRRLATNLDPNRDHIKLARQYTRDVKKQFSAFAPHIAVDMHEYSAATVYGGQYQHAADGLFSAAKNLNIHPDIRKMSEDLFAAGMGQKMEAAGLRWEPYVTGSSNSTPGSSILFAEAGSDGKIGRNGMGLTQCVTFLCETRGIALADQEFQRRTTSALNMVESIVQIAADNADEVYATMTGGIEAFTSGTENIVVTDYSTLEDRTFKMVDRINGSVVEAPIRLASTTPVTANLTRARPEAYLIPASWPDLAQRLADSGLEVQKLAYAYSGTVEALDIASAELASEYYEGTVQVTVTTEAKEKEVRLPAGSFLISTRQRNAALAFVALEPENIDSYVSFNIIPVEEGDEYSVFRVLG
ncbi:hypothetical protein F4778DRAFT_773935 [Xylariomycetidae sp. FL2044]|nr:hypothetical protein F4778DRAFT_773935 [Xylariomycetidae sp. FL2044]